MATSERKQAILAGLQTELGGNAYTHETAEITMTATMKNGSLLKTDNTEGLIADAATVVGVLDAPEIELYVDGDVFVARVAKRSVIANTDVLTFSDGAYTNETLTALAAAGVILQSADADFEYK